MSEAQPSPPSGMSAATARAIERTIIGISLAALALIFQPFSLTLFGLGCGLVVLGGLAFNLVPLCEPGRPLRSVVIAGLVVIAALMAVAGLAILSAWAYGVHFVGR